MTAVAFKDACVSFAQAAAPYFHITNDARYEEALELVEDLLEEAGEPADDPLNAVIEMLSHAIASYENKDDELLQFETRAMDQPADLAVLRLLMSQHGLGTADLPHQPGQSGGQCS